MKKKQWIWLALPGAVLLLCLALWLHGRSLPKDSPAQPAPAAEPDQTPEIQIEAPAAEPAYYDAVVWQGGFLAAGSQGRLAQIGADGSETVLLQTQDVTFYDIAAGDGQAAAIGDDGTVAVVAGDGSAAAYTIGTDAAFRSICRFRGQWLVGGDGGRLLQSADLTNWQAAPVSISGAVTGLAATEERCIGVTDLGEIFVTTDCVSWTVLDYNAYYQQSLSLQGIEALDTMFWAYGVRPDGASTIILSQEGGVWSERALILEGQTQELDLSQAEIGGLCSDGDQAIAALSDGTALTMPSCSVCNKLTEIAPWRLEAVACGGGQLLFVGEDFQYRLLELEEVRQERIQAEAAYEKYQAGALMIDVRTAEEYDQGHIAGSLRMDEDQVERDLPLMCPDKTQEIIFYCASGKRSQRALETARELGYLYVYNLGGLDDWPYGIEKSGK